LNFHAAFGSFWGARVFLYLWKKFSEDICYTGCAKPQPVLPPSHMMPEADGREIAFKTLELTFAGPHVWVPGRTNRS
jgi:hypothetical protein